MTQFYHQTSMSRGEIDPGLVDRIDAGFYEQAVARVENWFTGVSGRAFRRPPWEVVAVEDDGYVPQLGPQGLWGDFRVTRALSFGALDYLLDIRLDAGFPGDDVGNLSIVLRAYELGETSNGRPVVLRTLADEVLLSNVPPTPLLLQGLQRQISFAQVGPSIFITSRLFPPARFFIDGVGDMDFERVTWYRELLGVAEIDNGSNSWVGEGTLWTEQLSPSDEFRFGGQTFTVDTITDNTNMTTVENYTGLSVADARLTVAESDPFDGSPRLVAFFRGRLVLASSSGRPIGVWMSKPNDSFTIIPGSVYDDSPIDFDLFSDGADEFVWIRAGERIFLGSASGEYSVQSEGGLPITPTNFSYERISTVGGSAIQPVGSDATTMFVSRDRTRLVAAQFDISRQGFVTQDLTQLAPHLFSAAIREVVHRPPTRRDPTPRLFVLLDDYSHLTAVVSQEEGIIGWFRMSVPPGYVLSTLSTTATQTYTFLQSPPSGSGVNTFLCRLTPRFDRMVGPSAGTEPFYCLDAWWRYPGASLVSDILPLSLVHQDRLVAVVSENLGFLGFFDATTEVDLSEWSEDDLGDLMVGVPPPASIQFLPTLLIDTAQSEARGASLNRRRRSVRTILHLWGTPQILVNGAPLLSNTGYGTNTELDARSGRFERRQLGWKRADELTVEAASVYHAEILSVSREVSQ